MNDTYGRDYLALSGRLYSYSRTQGGGVNALPWAVMRRAFSPENVQTPGVGAATAVPTPIWRFCNYHIGEIHKAEPNIAINVLTNLMQLPYNAPHWRL